MSPYLLAWAREIVDAGLKRYNTTRERVFGVPASKAWDAVRVRRHIVKRLRSHLGLSWTKCARVCGCTVNAARSAGGAA